MVGKGQAKDPFRLDSPPQSHSRPPTLLLPSSIPLPLSYLPLTIHQSVWHWLTPECTQWRDLTGLDSWAATASTTIQRVCMKPEAAALRCWRDIYFPVKRGDTKPEVRGRKRRGWGTRQLHTLNNTPLNSQSNSRDPLCFLLAVAFGPCSGKKSLQGGSLPLS